MVFGKACSLRHVFHHPLPRFYPKCGDDHCRPSPALQVTGSFLRRHPGQSPGRSPTQAWRGLGWHSDAGQVGACHVNHVLSQPDNNGTSRFQDFINRLLWRSCFRLASWAFQFPIVCWSSGEGTTNLSECFRYFPMCKVIWIAEGCLKWLRTTKMGTAHQFQPDVSPWTAQEQKLCGPQDALDCSWCEPAAVVLRPPLWWSPQRACMDGWNPLSTWRCLQGKEWKVMENHLKITINDYGAW